MKTNNIKFCAKVQEFGRNKHKIFPICCLFMLDTHQYNPFTSKHTKSWGSKSDFAWGEVSPISNFSDFLFFLVFFLRSLSFAPLYRLIGTRPPHIKKNHRQSIGKILQTNLMFFGIYFF